ncbi:hypothetical protein E1B28_008093 [Marasmius oreades]|uniref:Uncharacterized protein n=1 Tax=Marasmius oreades TaxID=181124 RepID=A0A9P7S2W8_9AGAR|nr:uncharacterized protein E1B28_008093 [Marasmius oreades]KAG7094494.1 hypothetical protein E1B28_008093 [Marasmius oreades]
MFENKSSKSYPPTLRSMKHPTPQRTTKDYPPSQFFVSNDLVPSRSEVAHSDHASPASASSSLPSSGPPSTYQLTTNTPCMQYPDSEFQFQSQQFQFNLDDNFPATNGQQAGFSYENDDSQILNGPTNSNFHSTPYQIPGPYQFSTSTPDSYYMHPPTASPDPQFYNVEAENWISYPSGDSWQYPALPPPNPPSVSSCPVPHRGQVGSQAMTVVALSRRKNKPVFFCPVKGCISKGFTARHSFECEFIHPESLDTRSNLPYFR